LSQKENLQTLIKKGAAIRNHGNPYLKKHSPTSRKSARIFALTFINSGSYGATGLVKFKLKKKRIAA
jgi:hypothetical protein